MNGNSIWYGPIALMLAVFLFGLLVLDEKKGRKRRGKHGGEHA